MASLAATGSVFATDALGLVALVLSCRSVRRGGWEHQVRNERWRATEATVAELEGEIPYPLM